MLLSIIIPVYNVELYLRECLDSIFSQDLSDCEVIAVNDGSTDNSRDILETYIHKLTVVDKVNGGLSSARNAGLEKACGEYYYFLDSDDWLKPHAINSIKCAIKDAQNADVIYFENVFVGQPTCSKNNWREDVPLMDFRTFFNYAYNHQIGVAPNAVSYVYSSFYWKKAGLSFKEGIKYEDALFKYQLFIRNDGVINVFHLEKPFYVYRVGREGSNTTHVVLKNYMDLQYIWKTVDELLKSKGIQDIAFYHALFGGCVSRLYESYLNGYIRYSDKYWDKEDVRIMRCGVTNEQEYGLWLLAKLSPKWMARYYANDLPIFLRRLTNVFLTVCVNSHGDEFVG